jgi:hypothetical protein
MENGEKGMAFSSSSSSSSSSSKPTLASLVLT